MTYTVLLCCIYPTSTLSQAYFTHMGSLNGLSQSTGPQLGYHRSWCVTLCLWSVANKRTLATFRRVGHCVLVVGFIIIYHHHLHHHLLLGC